MCAKQHVRPPAVAGMFYEDSPSLLRKNVEEYLDNAQVSKPKHPVRGIVSPHAGHVYSGLAAAHAYKLIQGNTYECIIAVGPSHREYFGGVSIYPGEAYETPLGTVPVQAEIRDELVSQCTSIVMTTAGHRSEHCLEVQLPFLQVVLGEFPFVPIIMGDQDRRFCNELAKAIARVAAHRNILLVASSDLSHFHPYDEAVELDHRVINELEKFNPESFIDKIEARSFEACGGGPIAAVMKSAKSLGATEAEVLYYCNSGDITGDKSGVVGYLAAAFL